MLEPLTDFHTEIDLLRTNRGWNPLLTFTQKSIANKTQLCKAEIGAVFVKLKNKQ